MDEFYNKMLLFVLKQILRRIQKFQVGIIVQLTQFLIPLKKSLCAVHHTQNFLRKSQRGLTYPDWAQKIYYIHQSPRQILKCLTGF